jgi:hypothetical protein
VGSDDLGHWSLMLLKGLAGHKVHIVMAYQPVVQKATMIGSVYQQHQQRYMEEGLPLKTDPIVKFRNDLVTQLQAWRQHHEQLILLIDANENTENGPLNMALSAPGLMMREGVYLLHPSLPRTPTFQ